MDVPTDAAQPTIRACSDRVRAHDSLVYSLLVLGQTPCNYIVHTVQAGVSCKLLLACNKLEGPVHASGIRLAEPHGQRKSYSTGSTV